MGETKNTSFEIGSKTTLIVQIVLCLLIGLLSFFLLGNYFSDASTYSGVTEFLDGKRNNILALMATAAGSSALLAAIPADAGVPIANELMDMSSSFGIVLAAIYLEKYLLTLLGTLAFKVLVPVGCVIRIIALFTEKNSSLRSSLTQIAGKVALLGIALVLVVPCSVWVSEKVEATHGAYVMQEEAAQEEANAAQKAAEAEAAAADKKAEKEKSKAETSNDNSLPGKVSNIFDSLTNKAQKAVDDASSTAKKAASSAIEDGKQLINQLFEEFAIVIVTSCLIPILVLLLFIFIINMIMGTNFSLPKRTRHFRPFKKKGVIS